MKVELMSAHGTNPEIWRIWQPTVNAQQTVVSDIYLYPGDAISFNAGGCVQTGGKGKIRRSYVNPSGSNSVGLYHGTVSLPGWSDAIRINSFVPNRTQYVVPPGPPGSLSIGYEDDDYSDNGYPKHDDGAENQCGDNVDAWIEVTVTRAYEYWNHFYNRKRQRGTKQHEYLTPDTSGLPVMSAGSNGHTKEPPATLEPEGVTIETETDGSNPKSPSASRTVYLLPSGLCAAGFLRAELEFDMPDAPQGRDKKRGWGIALHFKNGNEMDQGSDIRMGPTCQFIDGGTKVRFHFTDGPSFVDLTHLPKVGYSNFKTQKNIFKLAVQICRDDNGVTASYGELYVDGLLLNRGTLAQQVPSLANTLVDPSLITAAGFAIVTQAGYPVLVRFRSFTLRYQYGPCVSKNPEPMGGEPLLIYEGDVQ